MGLVGQATDARPRRRSHPNDVASIENLTPHHHCPTTTRAGVNVREESTLIKFVRRAAAYLLLPLVAAGATLTLTAGPSSASTTTMATQVVNITNTVRARYGCPKLRVDSRLTKAAVLHSKDMAARGYFSHTSPGGRTFVTRAKLQGYAYPAAENIAWGQTTANAVMNAWMKSPGHKANIVNCRFKAIGVGVAYSSKKVPYWTQMFGWV